MSHANKSASNGSDSSAFFYGKKIWITGHRGMLGSALVRRLENEGANLLLTSRQDLDLCDQRAVFEWASQNRPDLVFHVGAKVGGIYANSTLPAYFLLDNLTIQSNVINAAHHSGVKKLMFVASNCTYPAKAPQPIAESALMTGPLDEHIRAYAISKIAGIEMCRAFRKQHGSNFISIIPPNLYGPGDNYHPEHSHVVAGILRRTHEAKLAGKSKFVVWGDGTPRREILHVDDLADAMACLMAAPLTHDLYNIGCGTDLSIAELARLIAEAVGFEGNIVYDTSKPNGTMAKLLDSSRIRDLGWSPKIDVLSGMRSAYRDFKRLLESPGATGRL